MVHASHSFYLQLFLERGINVFTWNYRGYGRSTGKPSPDCFASDIESVYEYLTKTLGVRGKIGVYGRSLGGIPSSILAPKVDMTIVDRTFCTLADMAKWKYHGKLASWLLKMGSCGWSVQSHKNFLKEIPEKSCYKVITQDKNDDIVHIQASLVIGVAREVCEQQVKKTKWTG